MKYWRNWWHEYLIAKSVHYLDHSGIPVPIIQILLVLYLLCLIKFSVALHFFFFCFSLFCDIGVIDHLESNAAKKSKPIFFHKVDCCIFWTANSCCALVRWFAGWNLVFGKFFLFLHHEGKRRVIVVLDLLCVSRSRTQPCQNFCSPFWTFFLLFRVFLLYFHFFTSKWGKTCNQKQDLDH